MIAVFCQKCGAEFRAADEFAGRMTHCKRCGVVISIPIRRATSNPSPPRAWLIGGPIGNARVIEYIRTNVADNETIIATVLGVGERQVSGLFSVREPVPQWAEPTSSSLTRR